MHTFMVHRPSHRVAAGKDGLTAVVTEKHGNPLEPGALAGHVLVGDAAAKWHRGGFAPARHRGVACAVFTAGRA